MKKPKSLALINGKFYENGQWVEILNPVTNQVIGLVPALKKGEIDQCYEAAFRAQTSWAETSLLTRIMILDKWKRLIVKNQTHLQTLMIAEIAKAKSAASSEIARSVEYIDYTFEEAKRLHPQAYNGDSWAINNKLGIFEYVAKGVVLAISPFNYPLNLAISKIFPALVTGNVVVFKPASQGSLTGLYLAKLAHDAGIPAGVFNAVTGKGSDIGDDLVANSHINVISFTGSAAVGKAIAAKSLQTDLILELGGKDPALVLADANLDDAASKIVKGAFSYSGQRCTAIKRVLVDEQIHHEFVKLLAEKINKLSVGKPEDDCDITPIIDQKTVEFVKKLINEALAAGASLVTGNQWEQNLLAPTLIDNVTPEMRIAWEEPFGPVLPVISFKRISEAIALANESNYGLQAAVFTTNINLAMSIAHKLTTGTVNINDQSQRGPDHFPFTGIKDSGLGVQGIRDSLLSFTRPKGIVINWKKGY